MVNFLLDHILEIRENMKYPIAMLLDEFTNFGKISGIEDTLSIIRKNKIGLVLGFQNYYQLEKVYNRKEAQIILDQPATQVYFKQKNYREAKELSDALGRTTIEEPTVTDSGRVQEFVQGRALATPEELINLKDQVIVFTPDTWPLKLPLTSPTAYNQALEYPPPERDKHQVSDFVKSRGRTARDQEERREEQPKKHPPNDRRGGSRGDRQRDKPKPDKIEKKKDQEVKRKPAVDDPPDLGDVWEL